MVSKSFGGTAARAAALLAAASVAACGGGGGGGGDAGPAPSSGSSSPTTPASPASITPADAVRLAKQASFGPTDQLVQQIVAAKTADAWIDQQFALKTSSYADFAQRAQVKNYCTTYYTGQNLTNCTREFFSFTPVQMRFYADAMQNDDQLRQRVAYALSQIIVASATEINSTAGVGAFQAILLDNAFGNYRDILKAVTLNPFMGDYLDMVDSNRTVPNENYARELMQLFSVGTAMLNTDGTPQKDSSGAPIATYTPQDVKEVARALTGWTYARLNGAAITDNNAWDYASPMIKVAARYDTGAKTFLGATVPANATQEASVDAVVDAVFNHQSTPAFISKQLIQQLVASNPSAGYVGRVAAKFINNGSGVRGDMKAVIRAILTDAEARGDARSGASDGKVKEPTLMLTSLGRLIEFRSDGYAFTTRDAALAQQPYRAPSVFNFYPPDYPLPLSTTLVSPSSKLMTTATIMARHNLIYDWTVSGETTRSEYQPQTVITGSTGTQPNWSAWESMGTDTARLIDRINLLMFNNTMTASQRSALTNAVEAIKNTDPTIQARRRAQMALYVAASSPQFQVDR